MSGVQAALPSDMEDKINSTKNFIVRPVSVARPSSVNRVHIIGIHKLLVVTFCDRKHRHLVQLMMA